MKTKQIEDWRRRLVTKAEKWQLRLTRVAVEDVINVGTVELPISLPLTVICGPNGVGKSTLIKTLHAAFQVGEVNTKEEPLLAKGKSAVSGSFGGDDFDVERNLAAPGEERPGLASTHYIETSRVPKAYQAYFRDAESVDDIINGLAKVSLDEKELKELGFLLGRDYRTIDVYEYGEEERWPFFEVSRGDDRYDSRTMGSGELACFHLWWRLKFVEKDSIVFIEEPETYISPYAQWAFAAFLMRFLYQTKSVGIVVSHSASFIQSVPLQSVVFVTRLGQNMKLIPRPKSEFLKKIGMNLPVDTICCVEDNRAADLLRAILHEFAYDYMQTTTIHVAGSEGDIRKMVSGTANLADCPRLFAVFDGDMHDKLPKDLEGYCAALPGAASAESIFRAYTVANAGTLSASLGQDIRPILDSLEGADDHDWFTKLAEDLHLAIPALLNIVFALWVQDDGNAAACRGFVDTIFPPLPEPADDEEPESAEEAVTVSETAVAVTGVNPVTSERLAARLRPLARAPAERNSVSSRYLPIAPQSLTCARRISLSYTPAYMFQYGS